MATYSKRETGILLLLLFVIVLSAVFALGVYHAGMIEVSIHEADGHDISFRLPAAVLAGAVHVIPPPHMRVAPTPGVELNRWLPLVTAATRELAKTPDCVLVDIRDGRDQVRIEKRRGRLIIDIEDGRDEVHVAVPLGFVTTATARLGWLFGAS
jgi:hypothetical protein